MVIRSESEVEQKLQDIVQHNVIPDELWAGWYEALRWVLCTED